jgi:hypothetical protein
LQLIAVHFQLFFLQQHNLGLVWNFSTKTGQALSFSNKLWQVRAEVDQKLITGILTASVVTSTIILDE